MSEKISLDSSEANNFLYKIQIVLFYPLKKCKNV